MMMRTLGDQSPLRRLALILLASFAVVAIAGCGIFSPDESDDSDNGGGEAVFPPPYVEDGAAGRDQLIENLELTYVELDFPEYEELLHDTYIFRIDPTEINAVGQFEFSRAEDVESTQAMFSGELGRERVLDAQDEWTGEYDIVPAVQAIRLTLNAASGSAWTLMVDGEFAGSWRKTFDVDMTVTYSGDAAVDSIVGKQVFYVVPGTVEQGGVTLEVWQMRAWEDQGIDS
ncbi:hypothetical protein DRQ53_07150 [bacterium]|nr:MAG: hypothetical protein DRQ53_07150 [bacterium]